MNINTKRIGFAISGIVALVLCALPSTSGGDNKSIQGTLRDTDGVLLVAGEIRAERLDAKAKPFITQTDGRGQYVFRGLPAGTYSVTAYVDDIPRARAKVRTSDKGWAKIDFDLRKIEQGKGDVDQMQTDLRMHTTLSGH